MNQYGRGDRERDRVTGWRLLARCVLVLGSALFCSLSQAASTFYDYDDLGRLKTVVHPNAVRMDYGLDPAGNRTVVTTRPAEGVLEFAVSSSAVREDVGTVDINITRTNGTAGTVGATLQFGGTASGGGTDYSVVQPTGTTITLGPGVTSATVRLTIVDDTLIEVPDETIVLTLSSPSGGALLGTRTRHTLTIGNNDAPPHPDQTPPTAPGNVRAVARSTTRVEVVWTSATDEGGSEIGLYLIERCTGATCTDFAQIGAKLPNGGEFPSDNYSYIDTPVAGSTTYRYRVRARDGAGNLGPYGGPDDATTPDLTGPTVPGTLEARSLDLASVELNWGESHDNGGSGLASYRVERCTGTDCTNFTEIAAVTTTTYTDTTVSGTQVYRYRVRARDVAENNSGYTNIVTTAPEDRQGPLAPTNVVASAESSSFVGVSWTAPFDPGGSGVEIYFVERCVGAGCTTNFVDFDTTTGTGTIDHTVAGATVYGYRVRARDGAGNYGLYSDIARVTTPARTPPTAPTNLSAVARNINTIEVIWTASSATEGSGIALYIVERCTGANCTDFVTVHSQPPNSGEFPSPTHSYRDTPLAAYTTYRYRVRARDGSTTYSEYSNIDDATTPDLTPPGAPGTLTTNASGASVSLTWGEATDTGGSGIASYRIERCTGAGCSNFAEVGTSAKDNTAFTDTSVASLTTYQYRVRARDGANNDGAPSNTASATTADFEAPTVPRNLEATTPDSSHVWLSWTASTDASGIQAYHVERCAGSGCSNFAEIGTQTAAGYGDGTVAGSTTYRYRVRARDGVGNYSTYTAPVSVTTRARTPPTVPGNFAAVARNTNRVEVVWTASSATDGSEIALYVIERCTGADCTNFASIGSKLPNGDDNGPSPNHSYNDTTVSGWTTYRYRMRARDGSNTYSAYTAIDDASTPDLAAPSQPGNLQITSPNSNTMNLTWVASTESGGSGLAAYHIERCTGSSCTNFAEIGQSSTNSYSDTTVVGTTAYRYRVRASDKAGNYSSYSNIQSLETSDTIAPNAPTNFTASSPNSSVVNLSWTAPFDGGGSGLSYYTVQRCTGAGCTNFSNVSSCFSNQTTCEDISVSGGTTYRYQVRAVDRAGNVGAWAGPISVTTPVGTPTTPSISISPGPVTTSTPYTVQWSASSGATHYELYRRLNGGTFSLFYSGTATSKSQASSAGSWSYQVRACNGSLCSAFSRQVDIEVCGGGGCN